MSSTNGISVSLDNPYSHVTIPRAKLRPSDDATVIANPVAFNNNSPYDVMGGGRANSEQPGSAPPPPYMVKEDGGEEGGGRCPACCYRCRRK